MNVPTLAFIMLASSRTGGRPAGQYQWYLIHELDGIHLFFGVFQVTSY